MEQPIPSSFMIVPWYEDSGIQYFIVGQNICVANKKFPKAIGEVYTLACSKAFPEIQKTLNELGYNDRAKVFLVEI